MAVPETRHRTTWSTRLDDGRIRCYREVLGVELPWLDAVVRAKRPQHLPVVLTRDEVRAVLQQLDGVPRLMALLLYGAGLRLLECCRLRAGRCPSPGAWRPRTFTVGPTRDRCTS